MSKSARSIGLPTFRDKKDYAHGHHRLLHPGLDACAARCGVRSFANKDK
jgi:hypothetical protein